MIRAALLAVAAFAAAPAVFAQTPAKLAVMERAAGSLPIPAFGAINPYSLPGGVCDGLMPWGPVYFLSAR